MIEKTLLVEFLLTKSDETLRQIITDYDEFEQNGFIGDCELRYTAKFFLNKIGAPTVTIVLWMREVYCISLRILWERANSHK